MSWSPSVHPNWDRFYRAVAKCGLGERIGNWNVSAYGFRWYLSPRTPWGQLLLHRFWREDDDPWCHDHPWSFVTIPLNFWGYVEEVPWRDVTKMVHVMGWLPHYRPASYTHRIIGRARWDHGVRVVKDKPMTSLVWRSVQKNSWGFVVDRDYALEKGWEAAEVYPFNPHRVWVHWRTYLGKTR